jgi:hypothetical protein
MWPALNLADHWTSLSDPARARKPRRKRGDLLSDLEETFNNLRKFRMMLNFKKCVFGVSSGKLLGYMVSSIRVQI